MNAPAKVLIIDDSEENRYTFGRYLRRGGFEVLEAPTAADGLRQALLSPDLIMLDIQLPDKNGFETCRLLKKNPATASIPVLHTSASFRDPSDRTEGLSGGADGYLIQPIDPEELLATVHALLRVRSAEKKANDLALQWKATFEAVNDGICLLDSSGAIRRTNPAFLQIFPQGDEKGSRLDLLLAKNSADKKFILEALASQEKRGRIVEIQNHFYQLTLNPIASGPLQAAGFACVFSDITAIRQAEETLRNHNAELEEKVRDRTSALHDANAQLESFCYTVAHDLRAPIRTMEGFSDVLMEDYSAQLDPDAQGYLARINKGAKRMDRLIQDLLKYSRLSRDKISLEQVNLFNCVNGLLHDSEKEFNKIREVFRIDIPAGLSVPAHPTTLQQAIWNILSNAVKFMPEGRSPEIRLSAVQNEQGTCLRIEDNGIGIEAEHLEKIFDMFERIHSDTYAGTGIGLAIVKRAMERMGGSVSVESTPGKGSTFLLEFKPSPQPEAA